ncbi:hypothetical protein Hanom_Chr08g00723871 [Helianthus anomalus]
MLTAYIFLSTFYFLNKMPFSAPDLTEKMDRVKEPAENGKIPNLLDPDAKKTNLWTKVAKLAKPRGRKWHFTYN